MDEHQASQSTATAAVAAAATNGVTGEERAPLALARSTPQPLREVQLPSTSDLDQHAPQLYSPTKAEIDSHPIRQRLSVVRDDISTACGSAPEEPPITESTRQEPIASTDTMADKDIKEGDEVSWKWSGSRPGGTVDEVVEEGQASVTSKRGNEIHKNAEPDNPAVKISRSGNDVVKKASELDVEEEGDKHKEAAGEEKTVGEDEEETPEENGEAQTGDKRKADDAAEEEEEEEDEEKEEKPAAAKKQKTTAQPKANGAKAAPKKKGRPAKKETNGDSKAKKDSKKREPKKAATESGQPRRSGRNKA
ncbi:hypothetical protein LTR36_007030 [Oleoguttula mirabilis]|uniref:Hypervirulence associated protein TUDOR domain-containing protein n=1 Tax=Oleoguttula mirabilis TaxID=1507867 RepID=A0AAV9JAQ3_9PEZI|nr:hypothetical protein LTR36_007030 [Oleoguttula mirabilis]